MKVWRLKFEVDLFDNLEPLISWSVEKNQTFDGRLHKKDWIKEKVKRMEPWKELELGDAPGFEIPVFSERAVSCLEPLIRDYVEFLPLESKEGKFYAVNITNILINALDYDKSEIIRFSSGNIMTIDKFDFKENAVKNNPIFKLEELKIGSTQFVTDEFVKLVKDNDLRGFCFELVWESNKSQIYNIEYQNKIHNLPLEEQKKIEGYDENYFPFFERIKREKEPSIQEGTIFAVHFRKKFCYGKVMCMQTKIHDISEENFVVCFSNELSDTLDKYPKHITMKNLLIGPIFVRKIFWEIGVCYTVDCIPLTIEEKNLNIGFFEETNDGIIKKYNIRGQIIKYNSQILTPCIESMLEDIEKEMIIELKLKGLW